MMPAIWLRAYRRVPVSSKIAPRPIKSRNNETIRRQQHLGRSDRYLDDLPDPWWTFLAISPICDRRL